MSRNKLNTNDLPDDAEPFWVQDIRLAQRRIEAQRAELSALARRPESKTVEDSGENVLPSVE